MTARTPLVPVDPRVRHTSGIALCSANRGRAGLMPADAADALANLHDVLRVFGRGLMVSDGLRSVAEQRTAREPYDRWLAAGKPKPAGPGQREHYAAMPGRSWHCAGRAIDLDVRALVPETVPVNDRVAEWKCVRDAIRRTGWVPITPDNAGPYVSEAWHYEYRGAWGRLHDGTPPDVGYEGAALGATLDVCSDEDRAYLDPTGWREVQAQLHRAGFDAGPIDGKPGDRTIAAVLASGWKGAASGTPPHALTHVRGLRDARS